MMSEDLEAPNPPSASDFPQDITEGMTSADDSAAWVPQSTSETAIVVSAEELGTSETPDAEDLPAQPPASPPPREFFAAIIYSLLKGFKAPRPSPPAQRSVGAHDRWRLRIVMDDLQGMVFALGNAVAAQTERTNQSSAHQHAPAQSATPQQHTAIGGNALTDVLSSFDGEYSPKTLEL